jgi:transposase
MGQEKITLTTTELKKVFVIEKLVAHQITVGEAAVSLGLSTRQVLRLKKAYMEEGAQGIVHKNRGRKPAHAIPDAVKEKVAELYQTKYYGSNHCHFAELLQEHESLTLSVSSVRRILLAKGIKQSKQRRRGKVHQPRSRKPQAGMLWQIDASPYAWLEDRGPQLTLHGAIDDATGTVVGAVFRETETREGYFCVMQQAIQQYGIPLGLYSDRHTIFRSPNEKLTWEQELAGEKKPLSHFGKAMAELEITHIKAMTPQAKGRIERLWGTFQDRLVIELRLLGVGTLEEANEVLPKLIEKHNRKFAVKPKEAESAYRKLPKETNLDHVFTIREHRQIGPGQTISYGGKIYTFAEKPTRPFEVKTVVEVRETMQGDLLVWHQGQALPLRETSKPQREMKTKTASPALPRKPAAHHPWRQAWVNKKNTSSVAQNAAVNQQT